MLRTRRCYATMLAGLLLALGCVGSAWAGPVPVPIEWGRDAAPDVAHAAPLAGAQVALDEWPQLIEVQRVGRYEFALESVTPRSPNGLGRAHLFLLRRRVDEPDSQRPWERVGGQIDHMDPREDADAPGAGVQIARLSCGLPTDTIAGCWVVYPNDGQLTVARLVQVEHGYSWERAQVDPGIARRVSEVAFVATVGEHGFLAWAQTDPHATTGSMVRLADVLWPIRGRMELRHVRSVGPGDRMQILADVVMVDDAREIRLYSLLSYLQDEPLTPIVRLDRAQATGRVLLATAPSGGGRLLVAEPAPGGTIVHQLAYRGPTLTLVEVGRYRFGNPLWLPSAAAPMALTTASPESFVPTDRSWIVVGVPGWPGPHALIEITPRRNETLDARVYQIPALPAPTGLDPGDPPRVIPELIGAVNATTPGGPPTVDLITSANLIRSNHTDVEHPLGQLRLLAARIITSAPGH